MSRLQAGTRTMLWLTLGFGVVDVTSAQEARVSLPACAKGIVVVEARFPDQGPLHSFALEIRAGDKGFVGAGAGPLRGTRFVGSLAGSLHEGDTMVAMVPVVARFVPGAEGFLFNEPGTYMLRWDIAFENQGAEPLRIEQAIDVGEPRTEDLQLLAQIGDVDFVADVFGMRFPDHTPTELVQLGVVAQVLEQAQSDPLEEGPWGLSTVSADALWRLAEAIPDSSYAAYLAYYAAGVYAAHLSQTPEGRDVSPAAKNHTLYRKADKVFEFVIAHGDCFIKPRALCARAYLRTCAADWDGADRLLRQAVEGADGQGPVRDIVSRMRRQLSKERREQKKADSLKD